MLARTNASTSSWVPATSAGQTSLTPHSANAWVRKMSRAIPNASTIRRKSSGSPRMLGSNTEFSVGSALASRTVPRESGRTSPGSAVIMRSSCSRWNRGCCTKAAWARWMKPICRSGTGHAPVLANRQTSDMFIVGSGARCSVMLIGLTIMAWSWKFSPTPGRSTSTGMSNSARCAAGPTPESISSLGVCTPPAHSSTSPSVRACFVPPSWRYSTPTARPFSISTFVTNDRALNVTLGRCRAGSR